MNTVPIPILKRIVQDVRQNVAFAYVHISDPQERRMYLEKLPEAGFTEQELLHRLINLNKLQLEVLNNQIYHQRNLISTALVSE